MTQEKLSFTRIDNNSYGNPRYVVHYLDLLTQEEANLPYTWNEKTGVSNKYAIALSRGKALGGKKYNGRAFGGGIVFCTYNLKNVVEKINAATGRNFILVGE